MDEQQQSMVHKNLGTYEKRRKMPIAAVKQRLQNFLRSSLKSDVLGDSIDQILEEPEAAEEILLKPPSAVKF